MGTQKMIVRTAELAALLLIATLARPLSAVNINFEAPTYSVGPLIGQDGWVKNAYFPDLNGTVNVSSTQPLQGSQSLSYTQTVAGGFADVSKPAAILVPPGVSGTDLTVSYVIKTGNGSFDAPFGGLFLSPGAAGGGSPIFARIAGGIVEVGSNLAVVPVNSFFFATGERIKMTYEVDFDTSTMNLILENLDFGDIFQEEFPFFTSYGSPTGPEGEYVVDVSALLRGGTVQIDDIQLTLGVGPLITEFTWAGTGSGNWNLATNWSPTGSPGTLAGRQTAILGSSINASSTIYNNSTRNLNKLQIDNANTYVIAGTGSLDFQSDASGPTTIAPSITVSAGAHQLQLAVNLFNNTSITVAPGASLDLNNQIDLNGHTLTTSGTVRINHSTVGGGTVNATGALVAQGAASIGGNLVSTGALVVGVDADGADALSVAGDAALSGILDIVWDASSLPTGPVTVLSAGGTLDASGLSLAPGDARAFSLSTDGNNLNVTFLGVAVPEPGALGMALVGLIGAARCARIRRRATAVVASAACLGALTAAPSAQAVSFTFENPPYVPGSITGQDGWNTGAYVLADPFFGGVVNGTVEISTNGPLSGSQSVLYTQTVDPPTAGGTGASDVGRPYAFFGVEDGTTAVDLTASFLIRADANVVGPGSMGVFLGEGGRSPIIVLLSNVSSSGGTGSVLVGDAGALPAAGTYVANNTYEFTIGVDLDNQNYEVFSRNVTAGGAAEKLLGSGPDGRFPFFGGAFADDGDGQTSTFDTSLLLRSGTGRIDNLTAVGSDFVQAVWAGGSGSWTNNPSWIPNLIPNAAAGTNAQIAIFGDRITAPQTVFTNATQTVNGLRFDNENKYAIAGSGAVALRANTIGGVVNPTINVVSGSHEMQVAVNILDNTTVTVSPDAAIDFNNNVNLGGKTLATSGAVNLNVGVTGGGTISNSGSLGTAGATPIAANLTSTGKLAIDLGPANTDRFNITGTATLSGVLDVVLEPGYVPVGSYTVLTSTGALNAAGLTLDPSDTSTFSLGVSGNSLVLTVGGTLPGDFNKDGFVNGADFTKWKGDFGPNNTGSDANGDGHSDGEDFLIWQRNFGRPPATPVADAVPEPTSACLAIASALVLGGLSQRRRTQINTGSAV